MSASRIHLNVLLQLVAVFAKLADIRRPHCGEGFKTARRLNEVVNIDDLWPSQQGTIARDNSKDVSFAEVSAPPLFGQIALLSLERERRQCATHSHCGDIQSLPVIDCTMASSICLVVDGADIQTTPVSSTAFARDTSDLCATGQNADLSCVLN